MFVHVVPFTVKKTKLNIIKCDEYNQGDIFYFQQYFTIKIHAWIILFFMIVIMFFLLMELYITIILI